MGWLDLEKVFYFWIGVCFVIGALCGACTAFFWKVLIG